MRSVAWTCLVVLTAVADSAATPADEWLGRLGSTDYTDRQAATEQLLADQPRTEQAIITMYAAAQTHEQRHRLMTVARHQLLRRLRQQVFANKQGPGSIGVAHEVVSPTQLPLLNESAILVIKTLPGFPAHEVLRSGDVILAVVGEAPFTSHRQGVSTTDLFNLYIQKRGAGGTVRLKVYRDRHVITLDVPLASSTALTKMYPRDFNQALAEPFAGQWAKLRTRLEAQGPPRSDLAAQPVAIRFDDQRRNTE